MPCLVTEVEVVDDMTELRAMFPDAGSPISAWIEARVSPTKASPIYVKNASSVST